MSSTPKLGGMSFTAIAEGQAQPQGHGPSKARKQTANGKVSKPVHANEVIKMTVKLTRADWERLQDLKKSHRHGFQRVAISGINMFLEQLGQPPLQMPALGEGE